jgi:hypothetical protein
MTEAFVGVIISVVLSAIVTLFVARHFYRKGGRRELSIYLANSTSLFEGVDPDVRSNLGLSYRNKRVEDLSVAEFVVANTGHAAITSFVRPLTLHLESETGPIDVSVPRKSPLDMTLGFDVIDSGPDSDVVFSFRLLNPGDWWSCKIIHPSPKFPTGRWTIHSEGLPASLKPRRLPEMSEADSPGRTIDSVVFMTFLIAPFLVYLAFVKQLFEGPLDTWINQLTGSLKVFAVLGEALFLVVSSLVLLVVFAGLAKGVSGFLAKLLRKVEQAGRRGFLNDYWNREET